MCLKILIFIVSLTVTSNGLRVPVEAHNNSDTESNESIQKNDTKIYTHLIPPKLDSNLDYHDPTNAQIERKVAINNGWYPIVQSTNIHREPIPIQEIPLYENLNISEVPIVNTRKNINNSEEEQNVEVPSLELKPPSLNAHNVYFARVNAEADHPSIINVLPHAIRANQNEYIRNSESYKRVEQPSLTLTPPHRTKRPTNLYPKKYQSGFVPVPIPIADYVDKSQLEIPTAKPVLSIRTPSSGPEIGIFNTSEEKQKYRKIEHKQKLQEFKEPVIRSHVSPVYEEQDTSETNAVAPAAPKRIIKEPLKASNRPAPKHHLINTPASDQRTEFRMHGMKGPHSYEFGYDTGKGKNRQFRYEARDNDGIVRGHYGYMDKSGKLRVVNYTADPKTGFQAEPSTEADER